MSDTLTRLELIMRLRRQGIKDVRVLNALEQVPRELFVSAAFLRDAYSDMPLPIECGETISQPSIVAYMTEHLGPDPGANVLEIGTGSGYQTAILASLFREIFTVDRHDMLLRAADQRFMALKLRNIICAQGDGWEGWPEGGTFDRIIVDAAVPEIPQPLLEQLAEGGRMIVAVGDEDEEQQLVRIRREGGEFLSEDLLPVRFAALAPAESR